MRLTFLYLPGRLERLQGIKQGTVPTEFFYGAPQLEEKGHTIKYLEVHDVTAESQIRIALELLIRKQLLPAKVYFALLDGVRKLLPELQGSDVVVATTPGIAFSLAILDSLPISSIKLPAELVAIHCGILNYPHHMTRLLWSRQLLKRMWTVLYGNGELESMIKRFRIPRERIAVNCFGVDEEFWSPEKNIDKQGYVLSIGNDCNRDYALLLEAARHLRQNVKLVTRQKMPQELPDNVELIYGSWDTRALDDEKLRDLYRNASCVVVPLKESIQPSGQSVTLQAMACETPVILTNTTGLWERTHLDNQENIMFVRPGKARDIVEAVDLLNHDKQLYHSICRSGREYVLQHGRISQFADRMEKMCIRATAHGAN